MPGNRGHYDGEDEDALKRQPSLSSRWQDRHGGWRKLPHHEEPRPVFGRRRYDPDSGHMITKRLVVVTVVLVDALYLAGDALLTGGNFCP